MDQVDHKEGRCHQGRLGNLGLGIAVFINAPEGVPGSTSGYAIACDTHTGRNKSVGNMHG